YLSLRRRRPRSTLFPYTTLFRSNMLNMQVDAGFKMPIPKTKHSFLEFAPNIMDGGMTLSVYMDVEDLKAINVGIGDGNYLPDGRDRKSTRLNSSHVKISYAVFCL